MRNSGLIFLSVIAFAFLIAWGDYGRATYYPTWYAGGTQVGVRDGGDFTAGNSISVSGADNGGNNRVDYTVAVDLTENAGPPVGTDCDAAAEYGRLILDTTNNRLYVCNSAVGRGWDYVALTD